MPDHYTPGAAPGTVANSYKSLSVECQEAVVGRLTNELTVKGVSSVGTDKLRDGDTDRAEAILHKLRAYSEAKVTPPAHLEGLAQGLVPKRTGGATAQSQSPAPAQAAPLFSQGEKGLADAERIANMPKDELVQICTVLGLSTEGHRDDLANRVLAHSDLGAVAAALGPVTPEQAKQALGSLLVAALREKCTKRGLPDDGVKAELIDRLVADGWPKDHVAK